MNKIEFRKEAVKRYIDKMDKWNELSYKEKEEEAIQIIKILFGDDEGFYKKTFQEQVQAIEDFFKRENLFIDYSLYPECKYITINMEQENLDVNDIISIHEDKLKDFTIEYKEYKLSDYFRYIGKNDYPNLYNLFMSKYNELLEKETNKNIEDYIDNIFAFLQRDDLYYNRNAISCNNSADLNIHTILEDTVLNKTFLVIKEKKLNTIESNFLSIDIDKHQELYNLYKMTHQKVVDIFLMD